MCTADGTWEFNIKLNRSLGDYNKCAEKSLRSLKISDEIYDDADILIHGDEDINPTTLVSLSLSLTSFSIVPLTVSHDSHHAIAITHAFTVFVGLSTEFFGTDY